jgi:hypothetical protein
MQGQPEPIDGVSLVPLFDGKMRERPLPIPFETLGGTGTKTSRGSPRMALVDNRFKLLTDMQGPGDQDLLFDLLADRGETKNIAAEHPDILKSMKGILVEFRESCKRSLAGKDYSTPFTPDKDDVHPNDRGSSRASKGRAATADAATSDEAPAKRPRKAGAATKPAPAKSVLQNDDSGIVSLTAAAATTHGDLTYRADQDKIGRWTSEKDWLSWELEIHQPGRFEVEVTCGQTEDGSVYEITVGEQKLRSVVSASGDFKQGKAQVAGELSLTKSGSYTLSLKPVSKKGPVVMTLWSVNLVPRSK